MKIETVKACNGRQTGASEAITARNLLRGIKRRAEGRLAVARVVA